jgi:hypothetical protein
MTTAAAPYRCPTSCDDDCEINGWGCHEAHDVPSHREHDPGACEAQMLAANLNRLVGMGFEIVTGTAKGPGASGVFAALERLDLDELPEFTAAGTASALGAALEWAEREAAKAAQAEPASGDCRGFQWIGQSFATCDRCGKPAWKHEGVQRLREGATLASLSDDSIWEVVPWKPGEADAIKRKWS